MLLSPRYTSSARLTPPHSIPRLGTTRTLRPRRTQPPYVFVFEPAAELSGDHYEYLVRKQGGTLATAGSVRRSLAI